MTYGAIASFDVSKCAEKAGCHKEKKRCWAYCGLDLKKMDWCYTTKGLTLSLDYVPCTRDSECNACWRCAGTCSI